MKKYFYILIVISIGLFMAFNFANAQKAVVFPIEELGNCASFRECADFCDQPENFKVCTQFSEEYGIAAPEETAKVKQVLEVIEEGTGPGGCASQDECEAYCDIPDHMEECIVFALENNLIPPEEIEEARAALAAIRQGATPPPCHGREACDEYCTQPENLEQCLTFGLAAGFISQEEAEMVRKTGGKGPGGCKGKQECDNYCRDSNHMEECMTFAMEHGLMREDELEDSQKMMAAIKKGVKPPDCRGREECDKYCSQPEHAEECTEFAIAAGFISPEEAENAKKMAKAGLTAGPGGCKGKQECEEFCDEPDNMIECVNFAEKAGFMSQEDAGRARKMGTMAGPGGCKNQQECEAYCNNPEHGDECMQFAIDAGFMTEEEAERARKMGDIQQRGGPGGCKSPEDCKTFCSKPENMQECMEFGKREGLMDEGRIRANEDMMMGNTPCGCKTQQECKECCRNMANLRECTEWGENSGFIKPEEAEENKRIMRQMNILPPEEERPEGRPVEEFSSERPPQGEMLCKTIEECNQMLREALNRPPEERPVEFQGLLEGTPVQGPPSGEMPSFEEMRDYCAKNFEDPVCKQGPAPEQIFFTPGGPMPLPAEGVMPVPSEGTMPPEGTMQPPPEGFTPPEGFVPPQEGIMPLPGETLPPPPSLQEQAPPPPSSEPTGPPPTEGTPQSILDLFLAVASMVLGFDVK